MFGRKTMDDEKQAELEVEGQAEPAPEPVITEPEHYVCPECETRVDEHNVDRHVAWHKMKAAREAGEVLGA